jgi:DHA1 family bicyclomycin/chloramphenicol resistance-like MFS transporter
MPTLTRGLIVLLGSLTAFAPLTIDMYLPSLPTLERVFAASSSAVQLTLSTFLLGLAVGQIFYGPISDRFGRRRPLIIGLTIYTLASLGCAHAPDIDSLIALRLVQALGGSAGAVIARAVVRDMVGPQESARVFSLLMLVMGVAPILAPLLGGYVLLWVDWRAIFWVLALFGLGCLIAALAHLPETRLPAARTRGGVLMALGVYRRLLSDRHFIGYAMATGFGTGGMFVYITASPHLLIEVYGVSAQAYGWIFGINAAGLIAAGQFNRVLLKTISFHRALTLGVLANFLSAAALLAIAVTGVGGLPVLLLPLFAVIATLGIVLPNATAAALASHAANAGSASAVMGVATFGTGALSAAVVAVFHTDSALAMAAVMAGSSTIAYAGHGILTRK